MSHEATSLQHLATQWRCISSCQEDFLVWHPMFATSLATKNHVASCRESRSSFYFSQCYATSCSVRHPHCNLSRNFLEKEPITIRHNQNAADIFKYSAGVKYNLIAGRKTSCIHTVHTRGNVIYLLINSLQMNSVFPLKISSLSWDQKVEFLTRLLYCWLRSEVIPRNGIILNTMKSQRCYPEFVDEILR